MSLKKYGRALTTKVHMVTAKLQGKEAFECPICSYSGPFMDVSPATGHRKHAKCPCCNALERHRLQYLVLRNVLSGMDTAKLRMLHFAPEPFFREYFSQRFGHYETADIEMKGVDHRVDLQQLPFDDGIYDFIFASHVLEHIPDDGKAISEIRRVLKPDGFAILPVPIVAERTIEYPEPNPYEAFHVRAPGYDYFDRYGSHFSRMELFRSDSLPENFQLYVYEDRRHWPTRECPLRPSMQGEKHMDVVPVCYA